PEPLIIQLKGINVHLQSAFTLLETLETFGNTGNVTPFEEITPTYLLAASRSVEGLELRDSNNRIGITRREAVKWKDIIQDQLTRINARQLERGGIRTVLANCEEGLWILQWGDEVLVRNAESGVVTPVVSEDGGFRLFLDAVSGSCVALDQKELAALE